MSPNYRQINWLILLSLLLALAPPVGAQQDTERVIERSSARLDRQPFDRGALLALGDALARRGRETGDAGYFERAAVILRRGVERHPADSALWRHLAYTLSLQHDFQGAITAAERAVTLAPDDADGHGVLGDALLELGRYDDASEAYDRMATLARNLAALSRLAGLANLRGDNAAAVKLMEDAVAAGRRDREPAESLAWAQWQLGMEHFQRGDLDRAARACRDALTSYPGYHRAHAGLAAVAAARGHLRHAERSYQQALAVVPSPEYVAALAQVQFAMGRRTEAEAQLQLLEQLAALAGGGLHREVAFFHLDRGEHLASILAQSEDDLVRRPDIQGHQLHAWALHKNGRHADARQAMARALRLGTRDARLHYQAGMIELANGNREAAVVHLREALRINPRFNAAQARQARATLVTLRRTPRV